MPPTPRPVHLTNKEPSNALLGASTTPRKLSSAPACAPTPSLRSKTTVEVGRSFQFRHELTSWDGLGVQPSNKEKLVQVRQGVLVGAFHA